MINRAKVKKLCHEHGRQAGREYLDALSRRVEIMVLNHCRTTGRKRLEAAAVNLSINHGGK